MTRLAAPTGSWRVRPPCRPPENGTTAVPRIAHAPPEVGGERTRTARPPAPAGHWTLVAAATRHGDSTVGSALTRFSSHVVTSASSGPLPGAGAR